MIWNKEKQYSNFRFAHFRFPTMRILDIIHVPNHKMHMFRLPISDFWDSDFALRNKFWKFYILCLIVNSARTKFPISDISQIRNPKCSNKEVRMYRFPISDILISEVFYFQIKKCRSSYFHIEMPDYRKPKKFDFSALFWVFVFYTIIVYNWK